MRTLLTLRPGLRGTERRVARYAGRLVQVRYRYDEARRRRLKTVELVVEEIPWDCPPPPLFEATVVEIPIAWEERGLRERVKPAGERWNPAKRVWHRPYARAPALGFRGRTAGSQIRIVPSVSAFGCFHLPVVPCIYTWMETVSVKPMVRRI